MQYSSKEEYWLWIVRCLMSFRHFRLPCEILQKVSAWTEMFYKGANLKLRSETTHFDRSFCRCSAIRGSQRFSAWTGWMPVRCRGQLYTMKFVSSALGLLNRDSLMFVVDINLGKVRPKWFNECLNQFPHKYFPVPNKNNSRYAIRTTHSASRNPLANQPPPLIPQS